MTDKDFDNRKNIIAKIEDKQKEIDELDDKIIDLLRQRSFKLREKYLDCFELTGEKYFCEVDNILEEFNKYHFESDLVKIAVANIRKLFFDDSIELYRKINCIDIKSSDWTSGNRIEFIFRDDHRTFGISIPTRPTGGDSFINSEYCGESVYIIGSTFDSVQYHGHCVSTPTVDLNLVKKELYDFLTDNKGIIIKKDKYIKCKTFQADIAKEFEYSKCYNDFEINNFQFK